MRDFANSVNSPTDSPISVSIPGENGAIATQVAQHLAGMHSVPSGIGMGTSGFGQPGGSNQFGSVSDSVYQNIAQFHLTHQFMGHQATNQLAAWNQVNQSQMPNHFLPSQPVHPTISGSQPTEIPDHLMHHRPVVNQSQPAVNHLSTSQQSPPNHNLLFTDNLQSEPEPRHLQSSRLSGSTNESGNARSYKGLIAHTINDSGKR